jgi:hypothetical protein
MADAKVPRVLLGEDDRPCAFEAPRVAIVGTRAATRLSIADAREFPRSVPTPASPWSTASQDGRNWLDTDTAHHHGRRRVGRGAVAQLTRRIPPHTSPCRSPTTHTNGNARAIAGLTVVGAPARCATASAGAPWHTNPAVINATATATRAIPTRAMTVPPPHDPRLIVATTPKARTPSAQGGGRDRRDRAKGPVPGRLAGRGPALARGLWPARAQAGPVVAHISQL